MRATDEQTWKSANEPSQLNALLVRYHQHLVRVSPARIAVTEVRLDSP